MSVLKNLTRQSRTEWWTAVWIGDGLPYEFVFTRHLYESLQLVQYELVQVEHQGRPLPDGHPAWARIHQHIQSLECDALSAN